MAHITDDDDVDIISRKLSFVSSSAEDQMAVGAKVGNMIVDYHTSLPVIVLPLSNNSDDQSFRFSINKIYKNMLILSLAFALLFTAYAGAAFVGLAAAPLWTAQATYLNQIARYYAQAKYQKTDVAVSLFFGIFFACVGTSTIWGNLISYFVLNQSNNPQKLNCGVYFDPQSAITMNTTNNVSEKT
ncbi:unnamed protein product, partial [Rotaria sp. Silwood1]